MLDVKFNGNRLREARRFRAKSITDLADDIGVTKQMVSKYENDKAVPSLEVLFRIISNLKFPREFFFGEDTFAMETEGTFFRSRLTSTQKEKKPSEFTKNMTVLIRDFLENYIDFPQLPIKPVIDKFDSIEAIAEQARKEFGLSDKPITNILRILEEHGFVVSLISNNMEKVDAFSSQTKINGNIYYTVVLEGEEYSYYRQQFSIAHELGHWILHSEVLDPQSLEKEEYREMEDEADEFAACFMLPREAFSKDVSLDPLNLDYYVNLKKKWQISIGAMVMRAFNLGIISSEDYQKLQRQISYRKWRTNEPLDNIKSISKPIALKQAIELLVENSVFKGHEIPKEILKKYNVLLPTEFIEEITNVERGYLEYQEPQIVTLVSEREKNHSEA
ncbi:transcriptional regulator [Bacillus pseudomycoides]|uniref:Transcriptional regulator n=1 Tax=Bacillus pseudomycoides TaxID=64104 RepID=A0AA91VFV4_9BACI|nr:MULTISPECIES: XRE family transcriptional regulator [Bacillus]PEB56975.1 transcriptional regulator [Bacillus sp. AFS098217]PED83405.1 transcriptional regulator [Bacillus pseudomycoides]PEU14947.1 transcriptional regulator [Bacillus sp. AFS014408]PEU15339.1 transcriptional regulator [Bacillus sp. AFS019443]PFW61083.1 transcriptional regulator [Bacillus sp. AFS075034]